MKNTLIVVGAVLAIGFNSFAQTNFPVKGTIDIKFNTRQTEKPPPRGVVDVYTVAVNVANSALFQGTIQDQPQLIEGVFSKSVTQPRVLTYDINCDVVNPKNPAQTKNVGRMIGKVPITTEGIYQYDRGNLEVAILPMGNAGGFFRSNRNLSNHSTNILGLSRILWVDHITINVIRQHTGLSDGFGEDTLNELRLVLNRPLKKSRISDINSNSVNINNSPRRWLFSLPSIKLDVDGSLHREVSLSKGVESDCQNGSDDD
jgi:hypothetical protein